MGGHLMHMSDERTLKKILTPSRMEQSVGRPKLRWEDGVAQDSQILGVKRWKNATLNRDELILIGWKIVPNEEHVQCDHCFTSQPLANEPLHSSQLFDTSLQKARGTTSLCGP